MNDEHVAPASRPRELFLGEVWSLRWDAEELATALVVSTFPDFVLVFPTTQVSPYDDEVAMRVDVELGEGSTSPFFVWPTRETGVGLHLLGERIGRVSTFSEVLEFAAACEQGPEAEPARGEVADPEEYSAWHESFILRWSSLCMHQWPPIQADHEYLDEDELHGAGVRLSELARVLEISNAEAEPYYRGLVPTPTSAIERLKVARTPATAHDGERPVLLRELSRPTWKASFEAIMAANEWDEHTARDTALQQLALAARARTEVDRSNRVGAVLRMLQQQA